MMPDIQDVVIRAHVGEGLKCMRVGIPGSQDKECCIGEVDASCTANWTVRGG